MDTTKTNTGTAPTQQDEFLKTLQDRLLSQSGMISSQDTNIEKTISETIASTQKAGEAAKGATESAYNRQIEQAKQTGELGSTKFLESGRGQAINQAAYAQMQKDIDTNLKDLEQRKQEVLLQGDAATASKIADLQLQSLTFKNEAMQRSFTNLLNTAGFALQSKTAETQAQQFNRTQTFQEKQAVATVALQYGLPVSEGDTLTSIISKAAPLATQEQKLQLAKLQSDINVNNAQIQKYAREGATAAALNNLDVNAFAQAYRINPEILATLKDSPQKIQQVLNTAATQEIPETSLAAQSFVSGGETDPETAWQTYSSTKNIVNKATAHDAFVQSFNKAVSAKENAQPRNNAPFGGAADFFQNLGFDMLSLTGMKPSSRTK